jgi:hypothetical protein
LYRGANYCASCHFDKVKDVTQKDLAGEILQGTVCQDCHMEPSTGSSTSKRGAMTRAIGRHWFRGVVVPGAIIKIKNSATNEERRATTNTAGRYTLSQLLPGKYELTAEMQGFRTYAQREVVLTAGQSAEISIGMQLGEVTQTVEIQGSILQVDSQTANREVTLDRDQVLDLPLNGGNRNPFNLIWTQAGVTAVRTGISTAPGDENQGRFAMNGGRDESVLLMIDGMPAISAPSPTLTSR